MRRIHRGILARIEQSGGADAGAVALLVALLLPVLLIFAALAVDVARWYVEAERVQKAADAASLAGVVFMPQDLPLAQTAALSTAAKNGYAPSSRVSITVAPGSRPSQLSVTVTSRITNTFGQIFGPGATTISRSAVADYNGPSPLGSPCSTFGNEPAGSPGAGPSTVLPVPPVNAACNSNPRFWAAVEGPQTGKVEGDRYMNRICYSGSARTVDGCAGNSNSEFRPEGYFFQVKVLDTSATGPITIQLYDPAWIDTGADCSALPDTMPSNNMNAFATTDARTRYDNTNNAFCSGDYSPGSNSGRVDTSFTVRTSPVNGNPLDGTPIAGCTKQYKGSTSAPTTSQLQLYRTAGNPSSGTNPGYVDELAQIFHQWTVLCTISSGQLAADRGSDGSATYFIQVRTNVALPSMSATQFIAVGNGQVTSQTGDNTSVTGAGANQFAIRAASSNGANVSVSGFERMVTDINASNPVTTFNLIRVLPGSAGKFVNFTYFDAADGVPGSGTVQVTRPTDATGSITSGSGITGCTGSGPSSGNLVACTATVTSSTNNGRLQTISVPIPADYSCAFSSPGGCWFQVVIRYSQATDIMTWSASVDGDPVRLVQ